MANLFQQQARLRKVTYTAVIVALFTGSLMLRRLVVEPAAEDLQLREVSRGEVDLTSSALKLTLTGSRGLAVTALWKAAIDQHARHKWNEVELLVGSITKLQPYFITPWLFQGWNLSFNVAVECDKPRDKYYYVSRGIQLLSEGERRNQGKLDKEGQPRFPGNPDMRFYLGFFYQLKIGTSDEKNVMQCLLDMSCIDPLKRDPEAMWAPGKEVNPEKFADFCRSQPRLVRRLNEALDHDTPKSVLDFLKDNQGIPSRFSETELLRGQKKLAPAREQFPIVPPKVADALLPAPLRGYWLDAEAPELGPEAFSWALLARTWYSYAQLPLPPALASIGAEHATYDPLRQRIPKHMTVVIFRGQHCLAQNNIANGLQKEGWFDEDGWANNKWFDRPVGKEPKYHSGLAWRKAHQLLRQYGISNGLLIFPDDHQKLEEKARLYRDEHKVGAGERRELRADLRVGEMEKSYLAHLKLAWNEHYRSITNYDSHLYETETEQDPRTVLARKWFFQAHQFKRSGALTDAMTYYEKAIPLWVEVLLDYPRYRRIQAVQEDLYEDELKYVRLLQGEKAGILKSLSMFAAQLGTWPGPLGDRLLLGAWPFPIYDKILSLGQQQAIIPIRNFHGPIDRIMVFEIDALLGQQPVPSQKYSYDADFKQTLLTWSQLGLPFPMLVYPGQASRLLTFAAVRPQTVRDSPWAPLIQANFIDMVRGRMKLPPLEKKERPPMPPFLKSGP